MQLHIPALAFFTYHGLRQSVERRRSAVPMVVFESKLSLDREVELRASRGLSVEPGSAMICETAYMCGTARLSAPMLRAIEQVGDETNSYSWPYIFTFGSGQFTVGIATRDGMNAQKEPRIRNWAHMLKDVIRGVSLFSDISRAYDLYANDQRIQPQCELDSQETCTRL